MGRRWRDLRCQPVDLVIRMQLVTRRGGRTPREVITPLRRARGCRAAAADDPAPTRGSSGSPAPARTPVCRRTRRRCRRPSRMAPAARPPPRRAVERSCTAAYPSVLHTRPPSQAAGDVSGAFVDASGCQLTLDGFNMFAIYDDPARVAFGQQDFDDIRARGFTVLRFIMPWAYFQSSPTRVDHLDLLDAAVRRPVRPACTSCSTSCTSTRRTARPELAGGDDDLGAIRDGAKTWVQTVARRYRYEPAVAAYDLINEPASADRNRVLELYSQMIAWVRAVAPAKIAMVNAALNGNSSMDRRYADAAHLRLRANIVHTTHDYYAGNPLSATVSDGYAANGIVQGFYTADGRTGYYDTGDQADFQAHLADDMNSLAEPTCHSWGRRVRDRGGSRQLRGMDRRQGRRLQPAAPGARVVALRVRGPLRDPGRGLPVASDGAVVAARARAHEAREAPS